MIGSNVLLYSTKYTMYFCIQYLDDSNVYHFQFLSFPKFLIENKMFFWCNLFCLGTDIGPDLWGLTHYNIVHLKLQLIMIFSTYNTSMDTYLGRVAL